jgi:hypothetical protein
MPINTMHLPVGDLSVSLANLRYWLEPWFKALDMEFETISNVLQHVHATMLRIELRAVVDSVSLAFNPVQPCASVLPRIGAQFDVANVPGRITVNIFL